MGFDNYRPAFARFLQGFVVLLQGFFAFLLPLQQKLEAKIT